MPGDFVRVRTENGMEATVSASFAESAELDIVADSPATNPWGQPLAESRKDGRPAKPRTTVKKAAAKKTAASKTAADKAPADNPNPGGAAAEAPEEGTA